MRNQLAVQTGLGLLIAISSACSSSSEESSKDTAVTIRSTGRPPTLVAIRPVTSATWETLMPTSPSTYTRVLSEPYRVVVMCDLDGETQIWQYRRTPDDATTIESSCGYTTDGLLHVRGEMAAPGLLLMSGTGQGDYRPNWSFDIQVNAGTHNLMMFAGDEATGYDQMAVRTGVTIAADTELGTIDIAQEHPLPMIPTTFTITGQEPSQSMTARLQIVSPAVNFVSTIRKTNAASATAMLAPTSLLKATDRQEMWLVSLNSLRGGVTDRTQRQRITLRDVKPGIAVSVAQPARIEGATFTTTASTLTAHWATGPTFEAMYLQWSTPATSTAPGTLYQDDATLRFLVATGASDTSASLDVSDLPGFREGWLADPAAVQARSLYLAVGADGSSGVDEYCDPTESKSACP